METSAESRHTVEGVCESRFESVREEFERNFEERNELGASVCVHLDGRPVVDLWGGVADQATGRPWERDTMVLMFSASKGATALCVHKLIERGELEFEGRVADYWPEFAKHGKDAVTIRQALNHTSGLPLIRATVPAQGYLDWDLMTSLIADEELFFEPGKQLAYHAVTGGWILGEVVRRVTGRSVGTFLREEVAEPLGIDLWMGLPEDQEARVARMVTPDPEASDHPPTLMVQAAVADPSSLPGLLLLNAGGFFDDPDAYHAAEIPAAGLISNARSLAAMFGPLSLNGAVDGVRLVEPATLARMRQVEVAGWDVCGLWPMRWASGFFRSMDNRSFGEDESMIIGEHAFGTMGFGGSVAFADPTYRISFSYAMNRMGGKVGGERVQSLIDALYTTLGATTNQPGAWV